MNSSWGQLDACQVTVDGAAYTGGASSIVLYSGFANEGPLGASYTVTGLGTDGVDWEIIEANGSVAYDGSTVQTVTLNILTGGGLDPIGPISGGYIDGDMVLMWDTSVGQGYSVQTNADLRTINWGIADTYVGDGGTLSYTNTPDMDQLFYIITTP